MTEFHTVKQIDNSRLVRTASPNRMRDCFRRATGPAIIGSCLLFCAWQHFQSIQLSYQIERLREDRTKAETLHQELRIEIAQLRSPMRIEAIARQDLGLTAPLPAMLAPAEGPSDAVLAQVRASGVAAGTSARP
jgi:cell division protein FtsL